jgi:hypothetical protein
VPSEDLSERGRWLSENLYVELKTSSDRQ